MKKVDFIHILQQDKQKENEPFREKIRLVYKPFFFTVVGFIAIYTLFHWGIIINLGMLSLKREVVIFYLPAILAAIPTLLWIRRRINLLELSEEWGISYGQRFRLKDLYYLVAWLVMIVPTIMLQEYVEKSSIKLTHLNNISEINSYPPSKYYSIENYYINWVNPSFYITTSERLNWHKYKHNTKTITTTIYAVAPIYLNKESTQEKPIAWVGEKYTESFSDEYNYDKIGKHKFIGTTKRKFPVNIRRPFTYLKRVEFSDSESFNAAIQNKTEDNIVLIPEYKKLEKQNGKRLVWTFMVLVLGLFIFFTMVDSARIDENKIDKFRKKNV